MCLLHLLHGIDAVDIDSQLVGCDQIEELLGIALKLLPGLNISKQCRACNSDALGRQ